MFTRKSVTFWVLLCYGDLNLVIIFVFRCTCMGHWNYDFYPYFCFRKLFIVSITPSPLQLVWGFEMLSRKGSPLALAFLSLVRLVCRHSTHTNRPSVDHSSSFLECPVSLVVSAGLKSRTVALIGRTISWPMIPLLRNTQHSDQPQCMGHRKRDNTSSCPQNIQAKGTSSRPSPLFSSTRL